ncbi:MAG: DbpA RNA binding domain-containing protein [Treponema sp.]|nr:DbpA RNA binding domain-containing protein [Treponema sp.]
MANDSNAPKLPSEALDLFLDGILAEVREPSDMAALKEARAAFRRRIPFPLRSYAAAILILRAAGVSRSGAKAPVKDSAVSDRPAREGLRKKDKEPRSPRAEKSPAPLPTAEEGLREPRGPRADSPQRPRFKGEGTTIFFSMGKRQRFHPRALIDLIVDVAGVNSEYIGEVRTFDNYSFADVDPEKAQAVVSTLNGVELRGRRLSVNLARKRDESPE